MSWNENYASDIDYTAEFYKELSPVFLNFVCVLNGFEPVPIDKPYAYCELGCGRGLTPNLLAASNPLGNFYAVDFMPSHIADAQELAKEAQLENMTFLENSFAELAAGKVALPQFDFITLHGVYSWVTQENRQHIVNFIGKYLKPGGIVYVSYNAMPGWSIKSPLQRLMVEHASLHPARSDIQVQHAIEFAMQLQSAEAAYFTQNPDLAAKIEKMQATEIEGKRYLVHEYMTSNSQPLYHMDIVRDLSTVKMSYIGSAELIFTFLNLYFTKPQQALLNGIFNSAFRETLKDYLINTNFRKDVFVRGARTMNETRQIHWLEKIEVALLCSLKEVVLPFDLESAATAVNYGICAPGPMLEALAIRPHTLTELVALPAFHGKKLIDLAKLVALLSGYNQIAVYFTDNLKTDPVSSHKMNQAISAKMLYTNDYLALASPLLANGIAITPIRIMIYHIIHQQEGPYDPEVIAQQLLDSRISDLLLKDNKKFDLPTLTEHVKNFIEEKIPLWQKMKLM